jgi:hypothetical protein
MILLIAIIEDRNVFCNSTNDARVKLCNNNAILFACRSSNIIGDYKSVRSQDVLMFQLQCFYISGCVLAELQLVGPSFLASPAVLDGSRPTSFLAGRVDEFGREIDPRHFCQNRKLCVREEAHYCWVLVRNGPMQWLLVVLSHWNRPNMKTAGTIWWREFKQCMHAMLEDLQKSRVTVALIHEFSTFANWNSTGPSPETAYARLRSMISRDGMRKGLPKSTRPRIDSVHSHTILAVTPVQREAIKGTHRVSLPATISFRTYESSTISSALQHLF